MPGQPSGCSQPPVWEQLSSAAAVAMHSYSGTTVILVTYITIVPPGA